MNYGNLPTRNEWESAGFKVPDELCSKPGQWSAEHLEALRTDAQGAEQRERELLLKLAECADLYARAKRACFVAQERYREAIRTN